MGSNADADLVFGLDLGDPEYGESGFVDSEDPEPEDKYEDFSEKLEDLFAEFAGWDEEPLTRVRHEEEPDRWDAWYAQVERKKAAITLSHVSYGYEFAGTVVNIGRSFTTCYGCQPISPDDIAVSDEDVDTMRRFVAFLDSKGYVLKDEFREPSWLLTASYG